MVRRSWASSRPSRRSQMTRSCVSTGRRQAGEPHAGAGPQGPELPAARAKLAGCPPPPARLHLGHPVVESQRVFQDQPPKAVGAKPQPRQEVQHGEHAVGEVLRTVEEAGVGEPGAGAAALAAREV